MRAVVYDHYGPPEVLRLAEVEQPRPAEGEVLVKIRSTTVNRLDCHTREANRRSGLAVSLLSRLVSGPTRPRQPILGSELAGDVVELGPGVREFKVGDAVFANTGLRFGAHAEYTCVPEAGRIAPKPASMTCDEAAAVSDGALNALWCLRRGNVKNGEEVLVYGSSGAIGTAGVQLAKHLGARVTAVCSTKNLGLMPTLGADEVIDYTKEDFTTNGRKYDVVFDAVGKLSFKRSRGSLKPGGRYLATDGLRNVALSVWTRRFGDRRVVFDLPPRYTKKDMLFMRDLIDAGHYRAVIDTRYPLDQVIDACRYVETEQKTGNVVLQVIA